MRTILSIWHSGSKGKSETLREFGNSLLIAYPSYIPAFPRVAIIPTTGDYRLVVEINGKRIGIESHGDPNTNLQQRLDDLVVNFKCDIILCSTRTRGETVNAVTNIAQARRYQTIWTSTYQIPNGSLQSVVNRLKAEHLLELLQTLNLI